MTRPAAPPPPPEDLDLHRGDGWKKVALWCPLCRGPVDGEPEVPWAQRPAGLFRCGACGMSFTVRGRLMKELRSHPFSKKASTP